MKRQPTKAEREHIDKVASLPCCVSGKRPVQVHHLRTGMGMGQRNSHYRTIPLAYEYHQGSKGIHTIGTKTWQKLYGSEEDLWLKTMEKIYGTDKNKWPTF